MGLEKEEIRTRFSRSNEHTAKNANAAKAATANRSVESPGSSGYESWVPVCKHLPDNRAIEQSSSSPRRHRQPAGSDLDYRRQFVLGLDHRSVRTHGRSQSPPMRAPLHSNLIARPRIGNARVIHQNKQYVTRVQMSNDSGNDSDNKKKKLTPTDNIRRTHNSLRPAELATTVPPPIWPWMTNEIAHMKSEPRHLESARDAIIEQNENYVTKILISPPHQQQHYGRTGSRLLDDRLRLPESNYDSIVTDSLLMWTSYEEDEQYGRPLKAERQISEPHQTAAETAEKSIRHLSQTIGQSQTIATVSRAFNRPNFTVFGSENFAFTGSDVVTQQETQGHREEDASFSSTKPSGPSSLSKGFSLVKDFWEKNGMLGNGRRLLVESDDDEHIVYRKSDMNFTPAKYWMHNELGEHDRLSNSSACSQSSSARRVTFSADTVDNEQSTKSTSSSSSKASATSSSSREIRLNPIYLPRQQQPNVRDYTETNAASSSGENEAGNQQAKDQPSPSAVSRDGRYGRYYSSNLGFYSDPSHDKR